ncbi:hypothetical protein [Campylobacter phage CJLB-10]|nr:hypothetical protein [Campylobacter phage CJLB-10]
METNTSVVGTLIAIVAVLVVISVNITTFLYSKRKNDDLTIKKYIKKGLKIVNFFLFPKIKDKELLDFLKISKILKKNCNISIKNN